MDPIKIILKILMFISQSTSSEGGSSMNGDGPDDERSGEGRKGEENEEPTEAKGGEPGASRLGNFINYYKFRSMEERVSKLPRTLYRCPESLSSQKYVALDIGCNAGNLTLEVYRYLVEKLPDTDVSVLGIDIDPVLIERAREQNDHPEAVTFECLDFLSSEREHVLASYLDRHQTTGFDATFCFSVTMWVHLNAGDAGLEKFLRDVCAYSETVLLEPQPWKCYRNASRRLRRAGEPDFPRLKELKYRTDVVEHIEWIITECGFRRMEVGERNDWQRRLLYYARPGT